jgi:hypothetical protein
VKRSGGIKKRVLKPKTRCSGTMTEAQFNSFIRGTLRSASRRWKPIGDALKAAWVSRGIYHCAGCDKDVPLSIKVNGKRVKNVSVDHISPVVDPTSGFIDWNMFICRLYCETDNLQVLCKDCHDKKTKIERLNK